MLRALPRASTWKTSEHVCLCCRRRLAQWQQTQGYSSTAVSQEYDDDWASSFNNIDAESQVKEQEDAVRRRQAKGFRKHDAADEDGRPIKRPETSRQRMAHERIPAFETLEEKLDNRLHEGKSASSPDGLSGPYQPFAYNLESTANDAPPAAFGNDALITSSRGTRKRQRQRERHPAAADEYEASPVATRASAGRVRDPKFDALIQALKADFAAKLPQIMRGDAMKSKQLSSRRQSDDANAGQPIRISEEPSAPDGRSRTRFPQVSTPKIVHVLSDTLMPNEYRKQDPATGVEKLEETRFRRMYYVAVKMAFPDSKSIPPLSVGVGDSSESRSAIDPVKSQAASAAITNDNHSQSTGSLHNAPDNARSSTVGQQTSSDNASLDFLSQAQQEQNLVAGTSTLENGTAEVAEAGNSTTHPLAVLSRLHATGFSNSHTMEVAKPVARRDSGHDDPSIANRLVSTKIARPSMFLTAGPSAITSRSGGLLPFHHTSKRSMSTTAQHRATAASDVESGPALGSSTEPIPPWGLAASGGKSAAHDIQQSSNDDDQAFMSLLPSAKQKKSARTPKSETKEKKSTSKKRAKSATKASDNVSEMLQSLLSKEQGRKASRASEKSVNKTKAQSSDDKAVKEKQARTSVKEAKQKKTHVPEKEVEGETTSEENSEHVADKPDASPRPGRHTRRARTFRKHMGTHAQTFRKQIASPRRRKLAMRRRVSSNEAINAHGIRTIKHSSDSTKTIETNEAKTADEVNDTRNLDTLQRELSQALSAREASAVVSIDAANLAITPLNLSQPPVPGLQYGLDRTLFNPGVFQLQDPHSRVYNFDPYLQKIMPVMEFDYNALKQYKTSSQDTALSDLAKEHGKRYIGSTSSMTGTLGHFHYLISAFRPLDLKMLSRSFPDKLESFTQINRAPNAIFLRSKGDGIYAIDADKEFDGPNVLMMLGKSMEKLLTLPKADYERYRKENSHEVTEDERTAPEAYEYTTMGGFLMRSQLDAHDPRLPGTGMFDLKTRAVVSVRMNTEDYEPMTGYEIQTLQGRFQSYEREYYDMMRSTMLKYMLQVRMGRMDGIFLAYHNVERIFGFQYVPLHEMDRALHWQTDSALGNQEFKLSLDLLNKALDKATAKFPNQSLRLHFETSEEQIGVGSPTVIMWIFAEPMAEDEIDQIQSASHERTAEFERNMMGIERDEADDVDDAESSATAINATSEEKTAAPVASEAHSTTVSDAAPTFAVELEKPRELKPLFSASIVCKSRVNDTVVQRPKFLKPEDKWELEYLLQEWDTNEMMWARYENTKGRRRGVLEKNLKDKAQENEEKDGNGKKKGGYVDFLKSMSEKGRAFRDKMDEVDAGKVPVVVGQPLYASEDAIENKIEGVDDYLGWLYRGDTQPVQEG